MDIGSEILSWEGHFVRESLYMLLFESISISLCVLNGVHLLIFRVCAKKKGNKCMYIVSFSIECIYWSLRLLYWVSCLWKFMCKLSRGSHLLMSIPLCILRVRDKWPFPRDSRSLSSPSLHTLVIWLFSITWFGWISGHSFSFDLFVLFMVFHLSCYIVLC